MVLLYKSGYSVTAIRRRLEEELICVSRIAIYKLLHKHRDGRGLGDREKNPRSRKLSEEHISFIDNSMAENDELSLRQLRHLLEDRWPGLKVSL